jgi:DNA-directed RNA polymerase subunit RPC12/RpoP
MSDNGEYLIDSIYMKFVDVLLSDVIKCPKCDRRISSMLTEQLTECKCENCGKEFDINLKIFIFEKG